MFAGVVDAGLLVLSRFANSTSQVPDWTVRREEECLYRGETNQINQISEGTSKSHGQAAVSLCGGVIVSFPFISDKIIASITPISHAAPWPSVLPHTNNQHDVWTKKGCGHASGKFIMRSQGSLVWHLLRFRIFLSFYNQMWDTAPLEFPVSMALFVTGAWSVSFAMFWLLQISLSGALSILNAHALVVLQN
jgi:hypothetical protein